MNTKTFAFAVLAALLTTPALAADLVNEDAIAYEIQVDDGEQARVITVQPGETVLKVCDDCVLSLGDSHLDAEEIPVAYIKNGVLDSK